jgi:type 2 lantibiotic biosynthesis protein LanM
VNAGVLTHDRTPTSFSRRKFEGVRRMTHEDTAPAPGLMPHLLSALSLSERASFLRRAATFRARPEADTRRAAATLARWKSRQPFSAGELFAERLRQDGLSEEDLLVVLGPPEDWAGIVDTALAWLQDLERLYAAPASLDDDPEFARYAEQGSNGFLWIAYPLIREGVRRFRKRVGAFAARGAPFDAASAERLVLPHLLATLKRALDLVMVLELNVARVQGALTGESSQERFRTFCDSLRRQDVRLAIAREYAVLFRTLHLRATNWLDFSVELLQRVEDDWELIRTRLAAGADPGELTSIDIGAGDRHRGGRTVAILEFSTGLRVVYKPHAQSIDVHFGEFLEWLNAAGFETPFRILHVIDRGSYGWSEFVTHQPCSSRNEVERFYRRLGGYLAAFHALRARDMHFENVIAASEFPVPVDLETLFHNDADVTEQYAPRSTLRSSVMQVMLLPQPVRLRGRRGRRHERPRREERTGVPDGENLVVGRGRDGRDAGGPRHDRAVMVARNRPTVEGEEVVAGEYLEAFVAGFRRVYRLLEERRHELQAPGGLLHRFADDEVRFVARPTATYGALLTPCVHPDRLRDAIERDQAFDVLWADAARHPALTRLIPAETKDLRGGDVPLFTSRPDSRDLWTSDGERIPDFFDRPAMALVREALDRMGDEDLARQERFIRMAVASAEEVPLPGTAAAVRLSAQRGALDLARAVGDQLCRYALQDEACANWIGVTPLASDGRATIHPLDAALYNGLAGCSLFLGYLGAATGDEAYERLALKSLNSVRRHLEHGRASGMAAPGVGAFTGLGGIIYTMTHLAVLWDDASLIEEAKALAAQVPDLVALDTSLDVIGGSAGAIAALDVLHRINASDDLLKAAVACGERLLQQQQPQHTGIGWKTGDFDRPLTGFSHGVAGIAWALLKLAAWSGDARFREAAESAIAYERSTFVPEQANWPDYRVPLRGDGSPPRCETAWCHGAPGIGLARIDSLRFMDDRETREEIHIALRKTVEAEFGVHHSLCHGDLGHLDVLLHAAQRVDGSWWSEAGERLARETLVGIAERGCLVSRQAHLVPPGLMIGLAGIGYGLLRLADPDRVPSVLVLAPPTARASP